MNKRMMFISLVLSVSLVVLGGNALASGYREHHGNRSSYPGGGRATFEASWFIGQRVNGRAGNYMGQISNLIIDQANDRVALLVLSGVPGFGADRVTIPYGCLERSGDHTFVARFPVLRQYPVDSPLYRIPQPIDPNWVAEVYRTYGLAPYWTQRGERAPLATDFFRFTKLIGAEIQSSQGELEARITNAIIDTSNGQIPLLVLSGVKGMGDSRVAVPSNLLSATDKDTFALSGTEDQLASAPSFHESDLNRPGYVAHVYRFFGLRPSWTEGGKARAIDPYRWGGEAQNF